MYGGRHEDGRVTDGLCSLTLELQTLHLPDGGAFGGGEFEAVPRVAGKDYVGHELYTLLAACLGGVADGGMSGDGIARLGTDDSKLHGGRTADAGREQNVGTHMSGRDSQTVHNGDAIGTLRPANGSIVTMHGEVLTVEFLKATAAPHHIHRRTVINGLACERQQGGE